MPPFDRVRQLGQSLAAKHADIQGSRDVPNHAYPQIPSSLNAGDHEMHQYGEYAAPFPPAYPSQPKMSTVPTYTPYLGLRARLSQVWLNRWTILLILIICRLLLATKDLKYDMDNAKSEALSACTSVEQAGSTMASMPHYMSEGVNSLVATGATKAVEGMMDMLLLSVTAIEEIVLFIIHMYTQTYMCLITLVISGSLEVAIEMIEKVGDFMNSTISGITKDIASGSEDLQDTINKVLSAINIGGALGKTAPTVNFTSEIDALNNIKIDPTTMDGDLAKLNASIPTFAQVQNFTDNIIKLPFEEVKKLINESVSGYTFDKSVFPVAQKQALTFCSDNNSINNFFDGLVKTIMDARLGFLIALTILAVLACVPMAWLECYKWRKMQDRARAIHTVSDPMDCVYIVSRSTTSTVGVKISERISPIQTKRRILVRWFVAYITSLPALFVLALGLAGLFSCICQYIVLVKVEKEVPALANEIGDFAGTVVKALNNASTAWAFAANDVINGTNVKINQDVFGWVNTSTTAVNDTLNTFTTEMISALNETFGGTILYGPVTGLYECLIGLKVASFEAGLTWAQDNAHVTFPEFDPDIFSLGAAASIASNDSSTDSFLAAPGGSATDGITSAVTKVATKVKEALRQEAIISACLVGLWFFLVLCGLIRVLVALLSRDKVRGEGGSTPSPAYNRHEVTGTYQRPGSDVAPDSPFPKSATAPMRDSLIPTYTRSAGSSYNPFTHPDDEKVGGVRAVGATTVEQSVRPGHDRNSSYGFLDEKR